MKHVPCTGMHLAPSVYPQHVVRSPLCIVLFQLQYTAIQECKGLHLYSKRCSRDNSDMISPDRILIVDDDAEIRSLLAEYLDGQGYETMTAQNGEAMWQALRSSRANLIVLDINMPGDDGLTLCRNLRTHSSTPVIMLTARGEPVDRILGLEMGADDYLAKPFEPRELLARIRSVMRRSKGSASLPGRSNAKQLLRFAGWTLDVNAGHLIGKDGVVVMLSFAELRLLKVFLDHPSRILTRDQLLNFTQGRDAEAFDRAIDVQISRLRQKLNDDARSPQIIKTVRSGGYILVAPVTEEN
jgi:two-component system OmpR family response regulator